jgi:carboxyl-terminal processing protease
LPLLLACALALHGQEPAAGLVASVATLESSSVAAIWLRLAELKEAHRDDAAGFEALSTAVHELRGGARLAGAALLYARGETALQRSGQVALQQLVRAPAAKELRLAAIRLLARPARLEEAFLTLRAVADAEEDPEVRIEAHVALWKLDNTPSLLAPVVKLLDDPRADLREEAALALAECGQLPDAAKAILRALRDVPTERGLRARLHLRLADRDPATASPPRPVAPPAGASPVEIGTGSWVSLLAELEALVFKHSLYAPGLTAHDLYVAAARGMIARIDEHSAFQDPDDVRQIESSRLGIHWGLGAELVKPERDAPLVIVKAYPGAPAYVAGLRTADRILEVNGVTTHNRDRAELERLTAGEPGEEVHLLVTRWGWLTPRTFSLKRDRVEIPTLRALMLPGGIGTIKLRRFGPRTAAEIEQALDRLEAEGVRAVILDLRDNPGGNLKQAIRVVDLFVGERKEPILTEQAPGRLTEWSTSPDEKPYHPTAVLVNALSSSAAEVVAGALQDFHRAMIIGKRTYGKGVKQSGFVLSGAAQKLLGGEARVLLSTGYLFTPLGRPIHGERTRDGRRVPGKEGGIEPDLEVDSFEDGFEGARLAEITRLQYSPAIDEYLRRNYAAMKQLFAEGDLWDPASYPGFQELHASLGTELSPSEVRHALRAMIKRHLEDERGSELPDDFREDPQLGRAILELCRQLRLPPSSIPEYHGLAERLRVPVEARGE